MKVPKFKKGDIVMTGALDPEFYFRFKAEVLGDGVEDADGDIVYQVKIETTDPKQGYVDTQREVNLEPYT